MVCAVGGGGGGDEGSTVEAGGGGGDDGLAAVGGGVAGLAAMGGPSGDTVGFPAVDSGASVRAPCSLSWAWRVVTSRSMSASVVGVARPVLVA